MQEKCKLLEIYGILKIPYDFIPDLFEHEIQNLYHNLHESDIARALIGFLNPKLTRKYPVAGELQEKLIENSEFIDVESCTNLIFELASSQQGSKALIEALKGRIVDLVKTADHESDAYIFLLKQIISFNLTGA